MPEFVRRYPLSFVALTALMLLAGAWALAYPQAPVPHLLLLLPATYLTTCLFEVATFVLIAIIFSKTREAALFALMLAFLACGMLDVALFVTTAFPGVGAVLPSAQEVAPPYLFVLWHAAMPVGATFYAVLRTKEHEFAPDVVRRLLDVAVPAAMILAAAGIVAIVDVSAWFPHLTAGGDLRAFRRSALAYVDIPLTVVAVVALARLLGRSTARGIDYAILLAVIASSVVIAISLAPITRFSVAWFTARIFYFVSSTFVLTAAIRDLVERYDASLRTEGEALRSEANAYRQNADVEASILKSRFVATVSHELRTPLGGIVGMAELLERSNPTEQQLACTRAIRSSADTLLRVVNDLLDFSRAQSGHLEIEDVPFDLEQTVEDAVGIFREQARLNGVALQVYIDPALPETVSGDPTRLKQVLQNLLNNAVRFTPAGSIRVEVARGTTSDGEVMKFAVHDTGIGIKPEAQERVFQPFEQEDASTARRFGGTGLGLSIAQHLVERMGGRIGLRSIAGVGTTFTFTIPFRAAARTANRALLRGGRVVIFERDPTALTVLERYVEGWEMAITRIASIGEISVAQPARCTFLIVGPSIPADEVRDVVAYIRENRPVLARTDTVLLRDHEADESATFPGFDAVLRGPLRQSTLFDALVRLRRLGIGDRIPAPIGGVPGRSLRPEHVLVADDNEVNQALLVAQLEHLGLRADLVSDGQDAVDAVRTKHYDLIFMDCQMPSMDGFEAARRIRALDGTSDIPIIAVTANVLPGYREVCLAAGMNDYLAKPALIGPLATIVDRWLPSDASVSDAPPAGAESAPAMRERLLAVFKGDEERVRAMIARSFATVEQGALDLRRLLDERDYDAAARVAHKLKGIAAEVGFDDIAAQAKAIESAARAGDDAAAGSALAAFVRSVNRTSGSDAATGIRT